MKDKVITPEMNELLMRSGSNDYNVAIAAQRELAIALTLPLKQGVLDGDIHSGIFETEVLKPGVAAEYPLDFLSPSNVKDFIAYTIPWTGRIPDRHVEGDFLMVPMYPIGASIDWPLKYARDCRWNMISRAMQVMEAQFVAKNNVDAWNTVSAAGAGRNLVTYDDAATAGLFSKRLVALMKTIMRRNAGGNSTSMDKGKLTDLFMSPEAIADIYSWDLTQVDDQTRRQISVTDKEDGLSPLVTILGVRMHDLDELGVGQVFQLYLANTLGATLPTDKVEFVIGLDLAHNDSFMHPVNEEMQIFEDPTFHRFRKAGLYGWASGGWAVCDARRVLLGAL